MGSSQARYSHRSISPHRQHPSSPRLWQHGRIRHFSLPPPCRQGRSHRSSVIADSTRAKVGYSAKIANSGGRSGIRPKASATRVKSDLSRRAAIRAARFEISPAGQSRQHSPQYPTSAIPKSAMFYTPIAPPTSTSINTIDADGAPQDKQDTNVATAIAGLGAGKFACGPRGRVYPLAKPH